MKTQRKFKITGLILGLFLTISTASASLLVEPHLGYNLGSSGDGESYNGGQFGMRLGYQQLGLMAGLDFTRSSYDQKSSNASNAPVLEMERNEFGVFVGYEFPILIRAWGAYYFSNKTEVSNRSSEFTGNTKELGVGFTALPFLSLNFMYRMIDLDKLKSNGVEYNITDGSMQEYVVGISLPLTL